MQKGRAVATNVRVPITFTRSQNEEVLRKLTTANISDTKVTTVDLATQTALVTAYMNMMADATARRIYGEFIDAAMALANNVDATKTAGLTTALGTARTAAQGNTLVKAFLDAQATIIPLVAVNPTPVPGQATPVVTIAEMI